MTPRERLLAKGLTLPPPPQPLGAYVPAVRAGDLLFLSGMLPLRDGRPVYTGTIGLDLDLATARSAAILALLNGLSAAEAALGGLEHVRRAVRLVVFQRTTPSFAAHAAVADAASEALAGLFEEPGHARMVFGVHSLPANMPIELELILEAC